MVRYSADYRTYLSISDSGIGERKETGLKSSLQVYETDRIRFQKQGVPTAVEKLAMEDLPRLPSYLTGSSGMSTPSTT